MAVMCFLLRAASIWNYSTAARRLFNGRQRCSVCDHYTLVRQPAGRYSVGPVINRRDVASGYDWKTNDRTNTKNNYYRQRRRQANMTWFLSDCMSNSCRSVRYYVDDVPVRFPISIGASVRKHCERKVKFALCQSQQPCSSRGRS